MPGDKDKLSQEAIEYRHKYYLDCIRYILDPLVAGARAGGFKVNLQGEDYVFVPVVAVIIQDAKEVGRQQQQLAS